MSRPQILFLVHRVPYPPNRGDRIRSFRLLDYMAARADVHLAFIAQEPPDPETMHALQRRCRRVFAATLGRRRRWLRGAWSLAAGRTATEGLFCSRVLRREIAGWAAATRFDAVVVFCSSMAQYLDLPGLAGVPAIVDLVDVDSQKWLDYAAQSRGLRRRLLQLEAGRLRRLESELSRRAKALLLVSRPEVDLYRAFCPGGSVYAIPNGVDLDYFRPADAAEGPGRCAFVGAMDYRANVDGVCWFCREVWPEVRRRRPEATFAVVGSNPSAPVRELAAIPGVEVIGEAPDVRPHLARADLVVVPLRIARGIQNKVLEGLAMGKAVLATPQAVEGLAARPGTELCEASTPEQWIESVLALLDDAPLRARLGLAGRRYVESHHRWEVQLRPFGELLGLDGPPCSPAADTERLVQTVGPI